MDRRSYPDGHQRALAFHGQLLVGMPGLLPACPGLYAAMVGNGSFSGAGCPPADLARRSRLYRQRSPGDRFRGDNGYDSARPGVAVCPRYRFAAFADVLPSCSHPGPLRRNIASARGARGVVPRDHAQKDDLRPRASYAHVQGGPGTHESRIDRRHPPAASGRLRCRQAL